MPLHFLVGDSADAGGSQVGDAVVLTGAEAHHAATVRRVRVGEEVTVGDGSGLWLTGECEQVSAREVVIRITNRAAVAAASPRLVLVQALAKGDRAELAAQAATELGADEIVPWQAQRSVSRWDAVKAEKGRGRWSAIVREAAKQAHRAWIPEVGRLLTTQQLAARAPASRMLVLEPAAEIPLTSLAFAIDDRRDVVVVIGPEGGIADGELDALSDAGAELMRLGDTVLRTSTAGTAALAVLSTALGRW